MLDLSALKFQVDTSELEKAQKVISDLAQDFTKIDRASQQAAKAQAQTDKLLAQAAKEHAQARKANADAADKEIKTIIAVDKADEARANNLKKQKEREVAAVEKAEAAKQKAQEKAEQQEQARQEKIAAQTQKRQESIEKQMQRDLQKRLGLLEREREVTDLMAQGYSRADSRFLAMAKSAGAFSSELVQLRETQRAMGPDPFDQSDTGLKRMSRALHEATQAQDLYNSGSMLNVKQAREMIRDQDRLVLSLQRQGKTTEEISSALQSYRTEYEKVAGQLNQASAAEDKIIKARQESANASKYVTAENERMAAALNQSNASLDKGATDKLVKYESSLRRMGLSQDEVTKRLGVYKTQLAQVQALEQKRSEQFLTRALAPQATDVVVSLWSGQNPLTVLLQQGGQINDLFMQSGIAAEKFGEVVKKSMASMLPSIMAVAKGIGGLIVDSFIAAGAGAVGFIGKMTGITSVVSHTTDLLYLMGGGWVAVAKAMEFVGKSATVLAGTAIFAIVAALAAMAIGLKQVISENNDLAKAFALSGGSIAASHLELTGFVKTLAASGATTGQATTALLDMAKAGVFAKDEILLVGKSAIEMNKNFGISIDDTVKQFAKLKEKPVEALIEIAQRSGMVAPEVLKMVNELDKAGKVSEAAALAMKTYANVTAEQVAQMKENYNGFALFIMKLGSTIKQFFSDTFKTLFVATDPNTQLANNLQAMQKRIDQLKGSVAYQAGSEVSKNQVRQLEEQARMISSQISSSVRLAAEEEKRRLGNVEGAKILEASIKLQKEAEDAIDKSTRKTLSLEDYRKEFVSKKLEDAAKEKNIDIDKLRTNTELVKLLEKQADVQYKKDHTKDAKQGLRDLETEIDLRNKDLGLLSSFNNELDAIERRRKATGNEDQYQKSLMALIEKQPVYIKQQKEINDAHDLENKLLGKSDMLGKDYYKTLELIQQRQDSGLYSPERAEQLRKAAFDQTELAKTRLKIEEDSAKVVEKYRDEIEKASIASTVENAKLDDRIALLGLTEDQQKKLKIQQEQKNKLLAVELKLQAQIQDVWDKWGNGEFGVDGATKAQAVILDLERQAGEERKNINREVAIAYAEDLDKEFRAIKGGISDSIVTALFEGGKAGSSKLRSVIIDALKKPVTLVVNTLVNTVVGGLLGSLAGGSSSASGAGGAAGGIGNLISLGQGAYSLYNTGLAGWVGSSVGSIFGTAAGNAALGTTLGLGSSSSLAAANAASMAGGGSGVLGIGAGSGGGMAGLGGLGVYGAIAALLGNAFGAFKSNKQVDSGLTGTLGEGDLSNYALWRRGGSLFSGPQYTNMNPSQLIKDKEAQLAEMRRNGSTPDATMYTLEQEIINLKKVYGDIIASTKVQSDAIQKSYEALRTNVGNMADTLGLSSEAVRKFTMNLSDTVINADTGEKGLSFKGLTDAEIQAKIQEALATANNTLAEQVIGTWENFTESITTTIDRIVGTGEDADHVFENVTTTTSGMRYVASEYARDGEKAIDTLTRLATSLGAVNSAFDALGYTLLESSLKGGDFASTIVDAFGGLEKFNTSVSAYYDAFYSQEEKLASARRQLSKEFDKLNLSLPNTRDEFRALVESQDLTTESGRNTYVALLGLSAAFANITTAAEDGASRISQNIADLKAETENLRVQLLNAQGKPLEAADLQFRIDTQGWTEAEIAIYKYNQALREQIAVATQFSNAMSNLGNTRFDLENQLLNLTGKGDEAKARERQRALEELTKGLSDEQAKQIIEAYDYNERLKEQIRLQQEAAQSASNAAQAASNAANQIKTAWSSVVDSLLAQVDKLRGAMAEDSAMSTDYYSALYKQTLAKAFGGDSEAASALPGLTDSYVQSAQGSVSSLSDLQSLRALLANDLELLARYTGNQQGISVSNPITSSPSSAPSVSSLSFPSTSSNNSQQSISIVGLNRLEQLVDKTNQLLENIKSTNKDTRDIARAVFDGETLAVRVE